MRDWAVLQARAGCYSQAALSSNDSKTLYLRSYAGSLLPGQDVRTLLQERCDHEPEGVEHREGVRLLLVVVAVAAAVARRGLIGGRLDGAVAVVVAVVDRTLRHGLGALIFTFSGISLGKFFFLRLKTTL